jgi:uncharacterized membrane protein SpoIIM required for sporulation
MLKIPNVTFMEVLLPLSLWILGVIFVFNTMPPSDISFEIIPLEDLEYNHFFIDVLKIFFNNLLVGVFLTYIGYITFGLFSIFVSLWNGVILGSILFDFLKYYPVEELISRMLHAPFEILALSIFAGLGLKNFWLIEDLVKNQNINLKKIPGFNDLLIPMLLLVLSSIIEVYYNV